VEYDETWLNKWLDGEVKAALAMEVVKREDLIWSTNPFNRCRATLEEKQGHSGYFGRCELKRKHPGYHALERGFDIVLFSTEIVSAYVDY
jgi:hypothetical protein